MVMELSSPCQQHVTLQVLRLSAAQVHHPEKFEVQVVDAQIADGCVAFGFVD
jgi:hypothetical protein